MPKEKRPGSKRGEMLPCAVCGTLFPAWSVRSRFCGDQCRRESDRLRCREAWKAHQEAERIRHLDWVNRNRSRLNASLRESRQRKNAVAEARRYAAYRRSGFLLVRTRPVVGMDTCWRACPPETRLLPEEQPVTFFELYEGRWCVRPAPGAPGHLRPVAERLARSEARRETRGKDRD